MRILIIGAGIAGLTLAALLCQRGEQPIIIEREAKLNDKGYMLGLYPLGSRVLHGLGLYPRYLARSVTMNRYAICSGNGKLIREYSLEPVTRRYGPIQGIARGTLIDLLRQGAGDTPIRFGTTVTALSYSNDEVAVTFSDGSSAGFDLVVAADGLHSDTRKLLLDKRDYAYKATGWGGWVFWTDPGLVPQDRYREYWGAGYFFGLYPTEDQLGGFVGGPVKSLKPLGFASFTQQVGKHIAFDKSVAPILRAALPNKGSDEPFFWKFEDCRIRRWHKNRVVFLGDAAVGFLPTAGIGTSVAMESAAALNDELSRTDAAHVEQALALYEKRRRQRVEKAQGSSRQLGRVMFVNSKPFAWGRNQLVKAYTVEQLFGSIAELLEEPI